jgi:hypothetical protein
MLTKADDYPIHQTPEPIAYAGSHRNFYDRYFFNGYLPDGSLFFAAALGVYPHLNVMDASFCIVHDGVQHNLHASKLLAMERLDTQVGPIEIEVIEPLEVLRLLVDSAEYGIKADLRFNARVGAIEEPRFTRRAGAMMSMDSTRMTQNGTYQGWLELDGKRFDAAQMLGTRDRSWGIRPVGMGDPQQNPYADAAQFYWLWAPFNFDDCATFYHLNDDAEGKPWNTSGVIAMLGDEAQVMTQVRSELTFIPGSRHAATARIELTDDAGAISTLNFEPQWHFYMKGLGYGHPEWGHGLYHGDLEVGFDSFALADMAPGDPGSLHIQAFGSATLTDTQGTRTGVGVLEQMIIGPHAPSGFKETLDLA